MDDGGSWAQVSEGGGRGVGDRAEEWGGCSVFTKHQRTIAYLWMGQWRNFRHAYVPHGERERERESQATGLMGNVVMVLCLVFDFHALLCPFSVSCVLPSVRVCLPPLSPHLFLVSSLVSVCLVSAFPLVRVRSLLLFSLVKLPPASPLVPPVSRLVCFWILVLCGSLICTLSFLLALCLLFCHFDPFSLFTSLSSQLLFVCLDKSSLFVLPNLASCE